MSNPFGRVHNRPTQEKLDEFVPAQKNCAAPSPLTRQTVTERDDEDTFHVQTGQTIDDSNGNSNSSNNGGENNAVVVVVNDNDGGNNNNNNNHSGQAGRTAVSKVVEGSVLVHRGRGSSGGEPAGKGFRTAQRHLQAHPGHHHHHHGATQVGRMDSFNEYLNSLMGIGGHDHGGGDGNRAVSPLSPPLEGVGAHSGGTTITNAQQLELHTGRGLGPLDLASDPRGMRPRKRRRPVSGGFSALTLDGNIDAALAATASAAAPPPNYSMSEDGLSSMMATSSGYPLTTMFDAIASGAAGDQHPLPGSYVPPQSPFYAASEPDMRESPMPEFSLGPYAHQHHTTATASANTHQHHLQAHPPPVAAQVNSDGINGVTNQGRDAHMAKQEPGGRDDDQGEEEQGEQGEGEAAMGGVVPRTLPPPPVSMVGADVAFHGSDEPTYGSDAFPSSRSNLSSSSRRTSASSADAHALQAVAEHAGRDRFASSASADSNPDRVRHCLCGNVITRKRRGKWCGSCSNRVPRKRRALAERGCRICFFQELWENSNDRGSLLRAVREGKLNWDWQQLVEENHALAESANAGCRCHGVCAADAALGQQVNVTAAMPVELSMDGAEAGKVTVAYCRVCEGIAEAKPGVKKDHAGGKVQGHTLACSGRHPKETAAGRQGGASGAAVTAPASGFIARSAYTISSPQSISSAGPPEPGKMTMELIQRVEELERQLSGARGVISALESEVSRLKAPGAGGSGGTRRGTVTHGAVPRPVAATTSDQVLLVPTPRNTSSSIGGAGGTGSVVETGVPPEPVAFALPVDRADVEALFSLRGVVFKDPVAAVIVSAGGLRGGGLYYVVGDAQDGMDTAE